MPRSELIHPLQQLGLPVTQETTQGWHHSRFYLRARSVGIRAAIRLAKAESFPMAAWALKQYEKPERQVAPKVPMFDLDELTSDERLALARQLGED